MRLNGKVAVGKDMMENMSHGDAGDVDNKAQTCEELQDSMTQEQKQALKTDCLMELVCSNENLNMAYKRVVANKGAAGIDKMNVYILKDWLQENKSALINQLLTATYQPSPVRAVAIPKPAGGTRQLGIPTVIDRMVQQALLQVLSPIIDPQFSDFSFGFRPGRSAHQALLKAQEYVNEGNWVVVDMDLEKFFDTVNQDILMVKLARKVSDKRALKLVRKFLQAGIMKNGVCIMREEGTPQGGPLSPFLANILLDDVDKELERRDHKFCRYADDFNIYVKSIKAGERVMKSLTKLIETKLKLKINRDKSMVSPVKERKFLGYRIQWGKLWIAPSSIERLKDKIRKITQRNRGVSLEAVVRDLNKIIPGWVRYFGLAKGAFVLKEIDHWMRRKVRCYRLKQFKRSFTIARVLKERGISGAEAWGIAKCGRGWWPMSTMLQIHHLMDFRWFEKLGLKSLEETYLSL